MRIQSLEIVPVRIPLQRAMRMATATVRHRDFLIVRVGLSDGTVGIGEGLVAPYFSGETLKGACVAVERYIWPRIQDRYAIECQQTSGEINRSVQGNGAAKVAVDMAVHDACGKLLGRPLWDLMGGRRRAEVRACAYVFASRPEEAYGEASAAWEAGYRLFKIKVGVGDPEEELDVIRAVYEGARNDVALHLDANQGWKRADAIAFLRRTGKYGVRLVEQPVARDDVAGMAMVKANVDIAVAADEGLFTREDLERHLAANAIDAIVLKIIKPGGLWAASDLASRAAAAGIAVYVSGMPGETRLATAAGVHMATTLPSLPFDTAFGDSHLADEVVDDALAPVAGWMTPPAGPGLGLSVDWARVEKYRVQV